MPREHLSVVKTVAIAVVVVYMTAAYTTMLVRYYQEGRARRRAEAEHELAEREHAEENNMPEQLYQVQFFVGAMDDYYYNVVHVHGLSGEEAQAFVKVAKMLGDCEDIIFDSATMMGDDSDAQRPVFGWDIETRPDGTEVRSKDREVHIYPQG